VGETNESKLVEAVRAKNRAGARLFVFGVGYDVNSRLLDRLARSHRGRTELVRADEDIGTYVTRLYQKIGSPVMTGLAVRFEFDALAVEQGEPVNRVYPRQVGDLFEGEQLVLVGRYRKSGPAKVRISGSIGGVERKFDFPAALVDHSPEQSHAFVEKLWAMRRIGEIIDELDLHGKNDELIQELVALSTKHGILTPYTSFLADENAAPGSLADNETSLRRAAALVDRLRESEGKSAFAQRSEKQQLQFAEQAAPAAATLAGAAAPMLRNIDSDRAEAVNAVQLVGNKVLYRRGNTWYTHDVARDAASQTAAGVQVVERFSDEYFRLVRETTPENQRILASQKDGEEVLLRHPAAAKVYRVK
jgi:Ca-activated chloride channel family protein